MHLLTWFVIVKPSSCQSGWNRLYQDCVEPTFAAVVELVCQLHMNSEPIGAWLDTTHCPAVLTREQLWIEYLPAIQWVVYGLILSWPSSARLTASSVHWRIAKGLWSITRMHSGLCIIVPPFFYAHVNSQKLFFVKPRLEFWSLQLWISESSEWVTRFGSGHLCAITCTGRLAPQWKKVRSSLMS